MRVVVAILLALLPCSPAAALSCMAPDFHRSWWYHADAPETYVLVYGRFGELRNRKRDPANDQVIWRATFTGMTTSRRAFDQPFTARVTIINHLYTGIAGGEADPDALARWLPGVEGLVYLRQTPTGYAVETGLCEALVDTDPQNVRLALRCLNNRHCPRP